MVITRRAGAALGVWMLLMGACSGGSEEGVTGSAGETATERAGQQTIGLEVGAATVVDAERSLFPTTAVDPRSGSVYVAWAREVPRPEGSDGDPLLEAVVARSDDGGETFGEPVVVSPPGMAVHTRSVSPTQVEVGPDSEVYVLFKHVEELAGYGSTRRLIHLVRSDDGGRSFSAPVDVASEAVEGVVTSMDMLDLFVAPDGDLFVSFLDSREKVAADLARADAPVGDGHEAGHGSATEREINTMRVARSSDGGRTFAPSTLVARHVCVCCGTEVTQGDGTPLFVTTRSEWMEHKDSKDPVRDPLLSVSSDEGRTWSEAVKIHDDGFKISGCPDVNAGLAVDSAGRLHATWYTGTDRGPGVYHAVSDDGGKTFSEPVAILTDEWIPYGDVVMALDDHDAAWIAYEDRRGEVDQIRMARIGPDGDLTYSEPWAGHTPELATAPDGVLVAWAAFGGGDDEEGTGSVSLAAVRSPTSPG